MKTPLRRAAVVALVLLAGLTAWHASLRRATGPAVGLHLEGRPLQPPDRPPAHATVRFGSFNIHGGKDLDGRSNLPRIAECLDGLDFAALQEVQGRTIFCTSDQAEQLGQMLGMQWLFAPAERRWYVMEFGNGLLSRLPTTSWRRIPLPRQHDRSHRNMVLAELKCRTNAQTPCKINLLLTHICRRSDAERDLQLRAVIEQYLSLTEPAVLLGDLNSTADDDRICELLGRPGIIDPLAKFSVDVPDRVDWIIVRGLRCIAAGAIDRGASDHPLVWAELELP